ncbi:MULTISPECIES: hypothetical protein [Lacticaseibacillus]|uniref:hypothetical protein n=1 Tax=Lacticaseibacillus TaxID=2759736 RepID=UPI00063DB630|nr:MULTISPECIES: hypothetical protein [Lacticaseibacillus]KLI75606.1 hypothetical protein AAW28_08900 [Lacticaseibacillus casei]
MVNAEWIAIIAEGAAEHAVMTLLIDHHLLKFEREDLLEQDIIRTRSATQFQKRHLDRAMDRKVHIYRILDSRHERFKLSPAYQKRVSKIEALYTRPEIEILYIINEGKFATFKKANAKPHEYVKQELSHLPKGNVKSRDYVTAYWEPQIENLVKTINDYARLTSDPFEQTLAAILRN